MMNKTVYIYLCKLLVLALLVTNPGLVWSAIDPLNAQKLLAADGADYDGFGHTVSISGDTAVIGIERRGAAYVYVRTGATWSQQAVLTAADGELALGYDVSISGDTVVIGAVGGSGPHGGYHGSAYIFTRTAGIWSQQAKLYASDGENGDDFGSSVSVSGDTVLISAVEDDNENGNNAGSVYIFVRSGTIWNQQVKITASDGVTFNRFGISVALDGDTALIGSQTASAYIFLRTGTAWAEQTTIPVSGNVALSGNTAVIGNTADKAAYIYTGSAASWTLQAQLTPIGGGTYSSFGRNVALSNDTLVVGDSSDNSAYLFTRSGIAWMQDAILTAPDGLNNIAYGGDVAVSGDTAIIGARWDTSNGLYAGAVYVHGPAYAVGGNVSGLATGTNVVLQNNAGDDLAISANGSFTFTTPVGVGYSYHVTVETQPTNPPQLCTVSNGSGTIVGSNISDVSVNCVDMYSVAGVASGLTVGNSVILQNNAGDDLIVDANGSFTFPTMMADQDAYEVTVLTQPSMPTQVCSISNESGAIDGADISNVLVSCVTPFTLTYVADINGHISGDANQTVTSGEDGTEVAAVPDSGYQLQTWSDGLLTAFRTDTNVTVDISVTASFELSSAPVITQGDAAILVTMDEDGAPVSFALTLNASDANSNDTLNWSISSPASSGSASASGTGTSKVINYLPAVDFNGSDSFAVQVSDGVDQDTITVNVVIAPIDDAPILANQIANQYVDEDASATVLDLSNTFSDVDSEITLSVHSNSNSSLLDATMVGTELTLSYLQDQNGSADITVRAMADGEIVDELFIVDVSPVNDAPVIRYGTMEFTDGVALVGQVEVSDPDDGDIFTFLLMSSDDEFLFTLESGGELSFKDPPDIKNPGDVNVDNRYEITVQVFDGTVTTDRAVTVLPGGCTFFVIPSGSGKMAVICL